MIDVLRAMVHAVVDGNRYLVLGTVEDDGQPRLSPVYYTHDAYRSFYWISEPTARHSRNVALRPAISVVIFDSSTLPGQSEAVYLGATARQIPDEELAAECEAAFRIGTAKGARAFAPEELCEGADLRLYRADATSYEVHVRGGHPTLGSGIDKRVAVPFPA
jgi:nitroimidazol reductase NimA-like FMN-containing flavoprotein (pyridoxamine 5'-phosphate oxidase superfamily)